MVFYSQGTDISTHKKPLDTKKALGFDKIMGWEKMWGTYLSLYYYVFHWQKKVLSYQHEKGGESAKVWQTWEIWWWCNSTS